jgi:hypothetical protein
MLKLSFLHTLGSLGDVVHSGASEERNVDTLFFMLGWDRYGIHKNCVGTHYAELLFMDRESYTHYFLSSGGTGTGLTKSASGHVMPNFIFCIRWDLRVT